MSECAGPAADDGNLRWDRHTRFRGSSVGLGQICPAIEPDPGFPYSDSRMGETNPLGYADFFVWMWPATVGSRGDLLALNRDQ